MARDFFEREAPRLARACHALARAFSRGGTLIASGEGAAATDAAHVAVEFMHPVIVGKRALPALALSNDPTGASTLEIAGPEDVALSLSHRRDDGGAASFLGEARRRGLLTIALGTYGDAAEADFGFAVEHEDEAIAQEVQETAYHVLWELVHVFLEQPGLLTDACISCGDAAVRARVVAVEGSTATVEAGGGREEVATELVPNAKVGDELLCHAGIALERLDAEPTDFLYPFQGPAREAGPDLDAVLADVEESARAKAEEVIALRAAIDPGPLARCAEEMRSRLDEGGRLFAFGNGGSATDAQDIARDALARGRPAVALTNDAATVTAVANDVGFERAFSRQLIALGRARDVALAVSTSGNSANLIEALEQAAQQGMLTVALAGYDGGRLAELEGLDHLFVVPSQHIPRIQEAQATTYHLLLEGIGSR